MSIFRTAVLGVFLSAAMIASGQSNKPPVRVAVVGLSHDHAYGFFPQLRGRTDVELAGVVETNRALIEIYSRRFSLSSNLFFPSLDDLFAHKKVQAVATFTSTFEHRAMLKAEFVRDKNGAFGLPRSGQESGASHPDRTHW
jgi:hypothetical protein